MTEKIDVFLLAAGEANRMYPLNQIIEKSLLPVDGKPVIRHIVDNIYRQLKHKQLLFRVGKITICCLNKYYKQFLHEFRDMKEVSILPFKEPMGTFDTFFLASLHEDVTKWVMVHYADCMTDINYRNFVYNLRDESSASYDGIIAITSTVQHDYSEVDFDIMTDYVTEFHEKPRVNNYTWSGIGLFHKRNLHLNYMRKGKDTDFAFDIFPQMIAKKKLKAYTYSGYWMDVGNLNSYRKVCELYDKNNGENK